MLRMAIMGVIGAVAGGVGFRLRGSSRFAAWTGRGATTARIACWAVPMALVAALAGAAWHQAILVGIGLYVGTVAPWWHSVTLGRDPTDGGALGQYLRHLARGLLWTAPAGALLALAAFAPWWDADELVPWWGAAWIGLAGLACVPAYALGWRLRPWGDPRSPGATEIAEAVFGAVVGASVVLAAATTGWS